MKRELAIGVTGLFLIVFMISWVSANQISLSGNDGLTTNLYEDDVYAETNISGELDSGEGIDLQIDCSGSELIGEAQISDFNGKTYTGILFGHCGSWEVPEEYGFERVRVMDGNILLNALEDNSTANGLFYLETWMNDSIILDKQLSLELFYENKADDTRISKLESWKSTISNLITDISNSITTLTTKVNSHQTKIEEYNARINTLEKKNCSCTNSSGNTSLPDYLKYLSFTDRKTVVCGYAKDNHLKNLVVLNANCTLVYRQYSTGERATCSCKEIKPLPGISPSPDQGQGEV